MKDGSKHNHYVWDWVHTNVGRVAVVMVLLDLVIDDLEIAQNMDGICLLKCGGSKNHVIISETADEIGGMDGCYLFYDTVTCHFICSGKANKTSLARYKQHVSNALKAIRLSLSSTNTILPRMPLPLVIPAKNILRT